MKALWLAGLMACSGYVIAQTSVEKTIPVKQGQTIEMILDEAEVVRMHTWDKNEILVKGEVTINRGENDSAFELRSSTSGNTVLVESNLADKDKIPHRILIHKDGQEYYFKTDKHNDPGIRKFLQENGQAYTWMNTGIIKKVILEVYIPKTSTCKLNVKFGIVEITGYNAPLMVHAPHGGIDVTVPLSSGQVTARSRFGEILTNLDVKFDTPLKHGDHDHWTEIQARLGNGPDFWFESAFGNVYLRKSR